MHTPSAPIARFLISISILALLVVGCAPAARSLSENYAQEAPAGAPEPAMEADASEAGNAYSSATGQTTEQMTERLVIKNANLSIVVDDPSKSMDNITRLADDLGGYVVSAQLTYSELDDGTEVPRASITLRVPAEKLDEAINAIQDESPRKPLNKNIESEDVTSEYTDLQSRLRNLEATEAQLAKIMDSATKTEDVLNVYRELTQVREQIEVIKGQIKYYEQSAAMSAISVDVLANAAIQPLTIGGWEPVGVAKDAIQALINAVKFLVSAGIWILLFILPVGLLIIVPIYLVIRLLLRLFSRRNKSKSGPPPAPAAGTPAQ